jgi:hypothetical protein
MVYTPSKWPNQDIEPSSQAGQQDIKVGYWFGYHGRYFISFNLGPVSKVLYPPQ